jgi:hypothetical protein
MADNFDFWEFFEGLYPKVKNDINDAGFVEVFFVLFVLLILLIILLLPLILWIKQMVRLNKKGKTGSFWIVLLLGIITTIIEFPLLGGVLFFGPLFAGLIGLCLGRGEDNFQCQFCFFKYKSDMLGGKTPHGENICLSCLRERERERERDKVAEHIRF